MAMIDVMAMMGEDSISNHYQVVIPNFWNLGSTTENLNMRVLSISIPERTIDTYEIIKRGRKMYRPNGVSAQELNVTFSFRADKYMTCYKSLVSWMNYIQNNQSMAMASDSGTEGLGGMSQYRHDVQVWGLNNLTTTAKPHSIWTCKGAYPTSVSGIEFSEDNGEPISVDVTINCMNIIYPLPTA